MRFSQIYTACWLLDDFFSIQGQICRGYKGDAKLERHGTSFRPSSTRWRRVVRSWQYMYTVLFISSNVLFQSCRDLLQILNNKTLLAHFPYIYLVSIDHAFYLNALWIDRYGCCSWTCAIASYRWCLVSSISSQPWTLTNTFKLRWLQSQLPIQEPRTHHRRMENPKCPR
jgi:hypothetical protein